ncbi:MAG: hypothetical protein OXF05_01535 [Hyphomicrobiales bacterium]|nr:hypothetical protein [Hyphomicrobiales bacterium]MCY4033054.1 hypothetical protein [Hyphomicrobiales bacterium]MCY4037934.1 hypothetical protein [Hyphomicrobiales bacterium]
MTTKLVSTGTTVFALALMAFAFHTNSATAGGNSDTQHTLWSSNQSQVDEMKDLDEGGETDVARSEPAYDWKWERDPNTGNFGWVKQYMNEGGGAGERVAIDTTSGDDDSWLRWIPPSWYLNEGEDGESELALGGCVTDWSSGRTVCCYPSSSGRGVACYYPNEEGAESEVAGLTRRQKQQQDEDDWNAWILRQFALPYSPAGECDPHAEGANCPSGNQDEAGAGQREFAAGARGGSFSSAGVKLGGLPTEIVDAAAEEIEDSLNERVLRSGSY